MKKEIKRFKLDPIFIWENIEKYIDKYIAINFKNYYYMKDDIKQDVYLKTMRYSTYDESKAKISTYLTTVCRNTILSIDSKQKRRIEKGYVFINKYDTIENNINYSTADHDFDKTLDENDLKEHIKILLKDFTRVEKYIIEEKFFKDKPNRDIYNSLQINNEKFKRYINRIIEKLKDVFENSDFIINYMIDNNIEFDKV